MLRLYLDENSHSRALVEGLRTRGFDCLTVNEAGLRGATDEEQLAYATADNRVLYTCDMKDFPVLADEWRAAGRLHGGIIMLSEQRTPIGIQLRCMERLVAHLAGREMNGRFEFLLAYREP